MELGAEIDLDEAIFHGGNRLLVTLNQMKVKQNMKKYKIIINTNWKVIETVWRKVKINWLLTTFLEVINMKFDW